MNESNLKWCFQRVGVTIAYLNAKHFYNLYALRIFPEIKLRKAFVLNHPVENLAWAAGYVDGAMHPILIDEPPQLS